MPSAPQPEGLADRCYAIAEALNQRSELALAVPFYRQAITLLLAQRDGRAGAWTAEICADDASLQSVLSADAERGVSAAAAVAGGPLPKELQSHLQALAEDLCLETAPSVRHVAQELLGDLPAPEAQLLALLAKTYLLEGELEQALLYFREALELDPADLRLAVNCGGALLACGDHGEAVKLLRPLARDLQAIEDPVVLRALLNNLATAELEAGHVKAAARLRADVAGLDPDAVPLEDWLADARTWMVAGWREEAKGLLMALRALFPRQPELLQLLAETLEACGDYRDAALVYRDLLRPALGSG